MDETAQLLAFLTARQCRLSTAESCTCGLMASLLGDLPGCGQVLDTGFVTYSVEAKQRLLGVRQATIDRYGLTSEEVAREMALGALAASSAELAVANTGVADASAEDPDGTQCFAYALGGEGEPVVISETVRFEGDRMQIRQRAAAYGLGRLIEAYRTLLAIRG